MGPAINSLCATSSIMKIRFVHDKFDLLRKMPNLGQWYSSSFYFRLAREYSQQNKQLIYSSESRMVRSTASGAEDSGLIPIRVKPMTLQLVFTSDGGSISKVGGGQNQ